MRPNAGAKTGAPPSEARIWANVLAGGCVMALIGAAKAIFEGIGPARFAPALAGAVLAGLIGWAGLRAIRRRGYDELFSSLLFLGALKSPPTAFASGFILSLAAALGVSLVLLAATPFTPKPAKPSPPDHPLYDPDFDRAASPAGLEGGGTGF